MTGRDIGREAVRQLAKWAARKLLLKAVVIAACILLALVLIVTAIGSILGASSAGASQMCGTGPGEPELAAGGGAVSTDQGIHAQQLANAKVIDQVAVGRGLSGRATLIALITALQESTLVNLDHGMGDSVGLFQQTPSNGWGTPAQLMDPAYAAGAFYGGPQPPSPPGLVEVAGWEAMEPGAAAQAVQHSNYPTLYSGHVSSARRLATEAGIDLDRAGTAPQPKPDYGLFDNSPKLFDDTPTGMPLAASGIEPCPRPPDGTPAGAPFFDGAADWPPEVRNPRSTADAIAWAQAQVGGPADWYRRCLAFVAIAYGWGFSGTDYAIDHYRQMPAHMRHDSDRSPPPGALLFWETGSRAGHVAVYVGGGRAASNDIRRPGHIDVVPVSDFENTWRATYVGWSPPYFPRGG